jgi:hypothetical protein
MSFIKENIKLRVRFTPGVTVNDECGRLDAMKNAPL